MNAFVAMLPASWQPKAKAVVSAIGCILAVVLVVFPVLPDWASAVVAALTALGIYATPAPGYVAPEVAAHRA
jgi:uncharacterized membrane protein YphA (DoxX/SURF4 family)